MKPGLLLHAVALTAGFGLIFLAVVATAANGWWPWVAILGVVLLTVVLATLRQNRGEVPAQSPGRPPFIRWARCPSTITRIWSVLLRACRL